MHLPEDALDLYGEIGVVVVTDSLLTVFYGVLSMNNLNSTTAAAVITFGIFASTVFGQADYAESFENNGANSGQGPGNLIAEGWIFRNESNPTDGVAFFDGDGFGGEPFDGTGYLGASSLATEWFGGEIDSWAILPTIADQIDGDLFTIWVSGGGSFNSSTALEVRYSPSGNTGTEFGSDGEGDFTDVLFDQSLPLAAQGYARVQVELPGNGRVAVRFRSPFVMSAFGNGAYLSLDTVSVGSTVADPCGIPIPNAGETVIWASADGPYSICQDLLIPAGGRVEVEPGAQIDFSGGTLRVEGEIECDASGLTPIVLSGTPGFNAGIEIAVGGSGVFINTDIDTRIHVAGTNTSLRVADSTLGGSAQLSGVGGLVDVDNSVFDGGSMGSFSSITGSVRLTNTSFINGGFASIGGLLYLDQVTIDGNMLRIAGESSAHPVLIENVSVTNNAAGPGIKAYGPNLLIGKNVTLSGNLYPLEMDLNGVGLLPGSSLPSLGNTNNYVPVEGFVFGQRRYWANTGVPYVIDNFAENYGGSMTIEPGANLKFRSGAGAFIVGSATLNLQGTLDKPIVLESFNPSSRWFGLKWVDDFDAKARHTIFDGGQITVQSDGGVMDLVHSTVQNSLEGTASVTGGIVRLFGTEIINNSTGMVTTSSGRIEADGSIAPNTFEGNSVAVEYNNNGSVPFLRWNWWGDATGPTNILNPDGMGDVVLNVHPAGFTPFLAAPPLIDDEFPTIEMMPVYFTAQKDDKIILRWSSSDDVDVVEHRVEFADHDFPSEFQTVAVLGGDVTTYEFTVPSVLPNNLYPTPSAIRIVAVDSAGQESWDKSVIRVPYQEDWTVTEQDIVSPTASVRPHENIDVCWSPTGFGDAFVLLDGYGIGRSAGGTTAGCLPIGATLPYSSTDTARIVVVTTFGAGARLHYSFSDYFTIRPDSGFGDTPPMVEVTSPSAGQQYISEGTIPVRWTASDDESLRSFTIQASYDGGRTWNYVAMDLSGDARGFDWALPISTGIDDVRVRVVAFDHRFQDTSDSTGAFSIAAMSPCLADLTGDGVLNFFDVSAFLNAFGAMDPSVDFTGDGVLNFFDVSVFLNAFTTGCP
jgi:hypothetical protein